MERKKQKNIEINYPEVHDFDFVIEIIDFTKNRIELEILRGENQYISDNNPRAIIITTVVSLAVSLFKSAIKTDDADKKIQMLSELMEEIKGSAIKGIKEEMGCEHE